MAIRVGHLNVHNRRAALKVALGWGCTSLGLNEANKLIRPIRRHPHYNAFWSPLAEDQRRGAKASPILVRENLYWSGALGLLLSDASHPDKWAPDRFVNAAFYREDGIDVAHFNFHNHAVVDNRRAKNVDRVAKAAEGLQDLRQILRMADRLGFARVLSGDLNNRDVSKSPDWQDAGEMLRAEGFKFRNVGVDWMAWDPERLELIRFRKIGRDVTLSDHQGLVADLRPVR